MIIEEAEGRGANRVPLNTIERIEITPPSPSCNKQEIMKTVLESRLTIYPNHHKSLEGNISTTKNICNFINISTTRNICNFINISTTRNTCNFINISNTRNICNFINISTTRNTCNFINISNTRNICNFINISTTSATENICFFRTLSKISTI
ncbi:hypothetical protein DNTS_034021 [Danionella cerebrum]|uniref:Uncharacterized protein n=1 Tax=Danionella cerebrum TaxID=2873325 RepID=A0A553QBM5_9TELE|nr:hypothetical protein DNTS_034021 [Danionella translucida]